MAAPAEEHHAMTMAGAAIVAGGLHAAGDRAKQVAEQRARRAQFAFIANASEKWIWAADEKEAFVPAKILKENPDGTLEVEAGVSQAVRILKKSEVGPPIIRVSELKQSYDDMVRMGDVNEATILHNLKLRFIDDHIYTNIGTILVSINPFKWIGHLYKSELIMEHLNTPPGETSDPHVFQIAAAAYSGLRSERLNQSIIISGESGAGKTEATKQCLKFFAEAAGSSSSGMSERLLAANPILEAFGNAKTVRNNNSSRFGKWMEVHFNGRAQICGSQIINYLLEKSRVAFQANAERSYHIFYQLCCAASPELRARLSLASAEEYSYTNKSNCVTVDGLDDKHEFKDLMESFDKLDIKEHEYLPMFTLVGALLHLSNVVFEAVDSDTCRMSGNANVGQELKHAARLLGVESDALRLALEQKLIETRNERVRTPLSAEKAMDCRNSMAKAIYGRMFDWLVSRVNQAMTGQLTTSANVIGVLDIFGFEIFEVNSFEQLCINFCNEKLQQHFNFHVFKAEEKCYKAEEIDYTEIKFVDNQDVLDLIEKKPDGLLPKLDDEVKVPRGSDQGFLEKIQKTHLENPRFKARIRKGTSNMDNEFGVNHYAGAVTYDVRGFLEKNKDELMLNVRELLASSKESYIQVIFSEENISAAQRVAQKEAAAATPGGSGGGAGATPSKAPAGGSDKLSQSSQFRTQLDSLMRTLNSTEPHYIRCIKPNSVKKGNIFDAPICLQQLRYAGVFEAVKVRQLGFPFRFTHEVFFKRYRYSCADPKLKVIIPKAQQAGYPWKDKCREVLKDLAIAAPEHLDPVEKLFKFGRTMVLYRADQHRVLEMIRDHMRETSAPNCQRVIRGHLKRKLFRAVLAIFTSIKEAIRSRDLERVQAALALGRGSPYPLFIMKELTVLETRLLEEKACKDALQKLYPVDPADHYAAYEAALKEAARLELKDAIVESCRYKFDTVKDRIETKNNVIKGTSLGDKNLILKALAKAEELAKDWGDILGADIRNAAMETLKLIEFEGQVQDDLRNAILSGGPSGAIGALDASTVDVSGLQAAIAAAQSGKVKVNTAMGQHLIATAKVLIDLRLALRAGGWAGIKSAVQAAVALRNEQKLVSEAEAEVKSAEAELADKRIQNELVTALSGGPLPDRVGVLTPRQSDVTTLTEAINRTKAASDAVGGLSSAAKHLLASAELLLKLRQAFASANGPDWSHIKKVVLEGLDARLAEPCVAELAAAKAELDNHIIVHQLTDALERGSAAGTVARLDTSVVDVSSLSERIAHAEEVGVATAQASALISLARVVRKLREALLRGDTDALLDIVRESRDVPPEFIPHVTADELLVARYEGENALIVKALSAAIRNGGAKGTVGAVDKSAIDLQLLHSAVKKCATMKCRSEEALWLLEVAENVAELRLEYAGARWSELQELILGLRGLHGARSSGTADKRLAELPVLRPPHQAHVGQGSGTVTSRPSMALARPTLPSADNRHMSTIEGAAALLSGRAAALSRPTGASEPAAPASPGQGTSGTGTGPNGSPPQASAIGFANGSRARGSSGDRNRPLSLRLASVPVPAGGSDAMGRGKAGGRGSTTLPGGAAEHHSDHSVYYLPQELLAEIALIQDELHNHVTVSELTAQIKNGVPFGELGALTCAGAGLQSPGSAQAGPSSLDSLAIACKKAARAGAKTPLAASLLYTGTVIRDLRASLRDGDWKTMEGTLKAVAANNARVARSLGRPLPPAPPPYLSINPGSGSMSPAPFAYMSTAALGPVPLEAPAQAGAGTLGQGAALTLSIDQACIAVAPEGLDEVVRFEAELQYKRLLEHLTSALAKGAASGVVGALLTNAMDTDSLAAAIDASRALGARTPQCRHLTALCRLMWQMRTAVVEADWPAVESLLVAGQPVLGTGPEGASTLEAGCTVPPHVSAEVQLYKSEAHNRRIVLTLRSALVNQAVTGDVGKLHIADLDVTSLQEGIKMALQLGVFTAEARCLVATAVHVRAMRLSLLGGQWEQLGAYLDYYFASEAKSNPYSMYARGVKGVQEAADQLAIMGSPGKEAATGRLVSTNTKDGLGCMGWWAGVVEPGLTSDGRNGSLDIMLEGVAPESGPEASLLQLELNNRNVIVELTRALSAGAAVGSTGKLDVSTLRTGELEWAIDYSTRLGCSTTEAETLLTTAQIVRRIRLSLGSMNWQGLEESLTAARGKVLADVGAAEIAAAQDELDNRVILSELTAALARGRPQGRVGRLFTGSIELGPLNEAIGLATRLVPKTTEAKQMLFTAKVLARLRGCLLNEDIAEASLTLEAVRGKLLATVALPEVMAVQDEVDNWAVCRDLADAVSRGGPTGDVGAMDTSTLDVTALEAVLAKADEIGVKTSEAVSLYTAAAQIYKLRVAMAQDDWEGSSSEASIQALLIQCASMPVTISDAAAAEIDFIRAESVNRRMILGLSEALSVGGAVGAVGGLDMSVVDTSKLDQAISAAVEAGPRTGDAERLLNAAKLIRRLRSVLLSGNWQWVGSVLLEARGMKSAFPPVSLKELQVAQDELDNRAVLAQVRDAMRQGGPSGGISSMDVSGIDVSAVDEALAYAKALGVKSAEAQSAVATATLLRNLRAALRINDYASAKEALEKAKESGTTLDSTATDELALVGMALDNWVVVSALSDAVSSGVPQGPLGDADPASVAVEALDAAIALTMKLGCNTGDAKRCLISAIIVRRLRQAFLDQDYTFMATVVAEAEKEHATLLAPARAELALGRDTLEFRTVMENLKVAASALDELALVEALARAGSLNMGQHPRTSVREVVDNAANTLGRIQRVKSALTTATRTLDVQALMEAVAQAQALGYSHACLGEAQAALVRIQDQAERASLALKGMDALGMAAALSEAEHTGLSLPVMAEVKRVLAMPRADFLRKELDALLNSIAAESMGSGSIAESKSSEPAPSTTPSVAPFTHGRAPSSIETRIINCTVQVKDLFFADAPNTDDVIASAFAQSASSAASVYLSGLGRSAGSPSGGFKAGAPVSAAAQQAIQQMKAQKHTEDNIKGSQARVTTGTLQMPAGMTLPLVLWTCSPSVTFKAAGAGRLTGPAALVALTQPSVATIGTVVPPSHSPLKRQFTLDKYPRLKPPHMYSSKFTPSTTLAESGLLRWSSEPIHTSITLLASAEARKASVRAFRHMLAFMGDRPLSKPLVLAHDILATGATMPEVRDEIFLQLCKQLTANPSSASMERGWVLLYLCLATFPPSEELENMLEVWLREHAAVPCVWALHCTLYRGGAGTAGVPSTTEIGAALERARAPSLPMYATDVESAGSIVEFTSSGALPLGHADMKGMGQAGALFAEHARLTGMLTSPQGAAQHYTGPAPTDEEEHRTQLAFLQGFTTSGTAASGRTSKPETALQPTEPEQQQQQPKKKPTPTKPVVPGVGAGHEEDRAGEYKGEYKSSSDQGGSHAALVGPVASSAMDRIAALLGEPSFSGGQGAKVAHTPTKPYATMGEESGPVGGMSSSWSPPHQQSSMVAKPSSASSGLQGSGPRRPPPLPAAQAYAPPSSSSSSGILGAYGGGTGAGTPKPPASVGGSQHAGLDAALEQKIAAIAKQLEDL